MTDLATLFSTASATHRKLRRVTEEMVCSSRRSPNLPRLDYLPI
jgi:hypothetical protein